MKEMALRYYQEGYNCSQCIIKAASNKYGFKLTDDDLNCCGGINNGFGIGNICSALVGGVMVLGIMFSEERAKLLRLQLFMQFRDCYGSLNCCTVSASCANCNAIVMNVAALTEKIVDAEIYSRKK